MQISEAEMLKVAKDSFNYLIEGYKLTKVFESEKWCVIYGVFMVLGENHKDPEIKSCLQYLRGFLDAKGVERIDNRCGG